ncbi:FadR/GntR family transcriptional regulator [Paraglaciecola sp. L3A3]|uniref:FadR/GntR family transcriptional regulator n=1 Tax=Paraglaciecola sp. L3A3 TaxID=2686358 RepID=UPI00131E66BE|nr:FadR/GntR family transcriptional regulator [Paraglaciecola sp. L3A3]
MAPQTATANLIETIAKKILSSEYPESTLLPSENELAKDFKLSRTTVRSALQALSAKRMVTIIPKKGSFVNASETWNWLDHDILGWLSSIKVNHSDLSHLMAARLIFEPNTSALAALNATAKDLFLMEEACDEMQQGVEQGDRSLFNQGDIKFHRALLIASHNPFIIAIGDVLSKGLVLSFSHTMDKNLPESKPAVAEHVKLLEAIRLRQPDAAREQTRVIVLNAIRKNQEAEPNYISHIG